MTKMQEYSRLMTESSNWFTFWSDKYYWSGGNQFLPALFIFSTSFLPAYLAVLSTGSHLPCPAGLQLRFTLGFISSDRQCRHNCRARPQHSNRISKILKNLIPPGSTHFNLYEQSQTNFDTYLITPERFP